MSRMKTAFFGVAFLVFLPVWGLAQERVELVSMSRDPGLDSTRIVFELTKTPSFQVDHSGQRVEVTFRRAVPGDSLQPLSSGGDIVDCLIAGEGKESLTVSVLLRRPPEHVGKLTARDQRAEIEIHWPKQGQEARPGLSMDPQGFFQAGAGKAVGARVLKSKYSGDWGRFLVEHEAPVALDVPMRFTRMPYPVAVSEETEAELPGPVREAADSADWAQALQGLEEAAEDSRQRYPGLNAELLLRLGRSAQAEKALDSIFPPSGISGSVPGRLHLLRAYSLLAQDRPYLAYCHLFSFSDRGKLRGRTKRYWRVLEVELALATGRPKQALELIGEYEQARQTKGQSREDRLADILALRRVQALSVLGKKQQAREASQSLNVSLQRMLDAPQAARTIASLYYEREMFGRARPVYTQLASELHPKREKALAMWRAGMCLWRGGHPELARKKLQAVIDEYPHTAAEHRARLGLTGMAVGKSLPEVRMEHIEVYRTVAVSSPERVVREEASLKRIIALYQLGELEEAADELTLFLAHFAAGPLRYEAQSLLVELVPKLVPMLFNQGRMIKGMALVSKHRNELVKTDLPDEFLWAMGNAFADLGLYRRASRVFLYMLARAEEGAEQGRLYVRVLRLWSREGRLKEVGKYARMYARKYPQGRYRKKVMALAARIRLEDGEPAKALAPLLQSSRPLSRELDILTAKALYAGEEFERMERYIQRARGSHKRLPPELRFMWGRALAAMGHTERALSVFRALGQGTSVYKPAAQYQAAELLLDSGQPKAAVKAYRELVEKGEGSLWAELAGEGGFLAEYQDVVSKN